MSPQGVMTREQASYSPGLNSIEGQKFCPGIQTRSRDKLPSLSLGISKNLPLSPVLVDQPATEPLLQIPPGDTQGRLGAEKPQSRATPCELICDFIASYSGMARDPKEAHRKPVRDIIQRLLALDTRCTRYTDLANIGVAIYVSICGIFSDALSVWTAQQ